MPQEKTLHPATQQLVQWFEFDHLPAHLHEVASDFHFVAWNMVRQELDGPEVTAGLRKLLEAKDCFVRAAIAKSRQNEAKQG